MNLLSLINPSLAKFTVAPYYQIMAQLDLKDSSRNFTRKLCNGFFYRPHLILHAYIQTFDVMGEKFLF